MKKIRFAILAGVSTEIQARENKLSIPDQVKHCRDRIRQLDGIETAGPFVMDGYSRSGYDSLDVAMQEIPPLGEAIRAAQGDQYDILIMDNFDRLGDLGVIVKTRFKKIRKQLYSARQSGKITHPDQYNPYESEDADIAMYVEGIIQSYRINKIRRGWNIGIPKRAQSGLHPLSLTFGYKLAGKNEPAVQVPEEVSLIIKLKDMFLEGRPIQQLCDFANASGVKPRRAPAWSITVVRRMILNPYYAGIIVFGRIKTENKRRIITPPSEWQRAKGLHQPLWDEATYYAILAEQERRTSSRSRAVRHALSGILECSVCGTKVYRHGKRWIYVNCERPNSHINMRYEKALQLVAEKVTAELRLIHNAPAPVDPTAAIDQQLRDLHARRTRIQEGFEANLYDAREARAKIVAVETDIERVTRKRERAAQKIVQKQALLTVAGQDLSRMVHWIINDDPTAVNHFLSTLCEKIIITPKGKVTLVWR